MVVLNGVQIPRSGKRALAKKETTLVNISRLSREKGMDVLLDIVRSLSQSIRVLDCSLSVMAPERVSLERKARECGIEKYVSFLGFRHDVSNLLEQADMYITASRGGYATDGSRSHGGITSCCSIQCCWQRGCCGSQEKRLSLQYQQAERGIGISIGTY